MNLIMFESIHRYDYYSILCSTELNSVHMTLKESIIANICERWTSRASDVPQFELMNGFKLIDSNQFEYMAWFE